MTEVLTSNGGSEVPCCRVCHGESEPDNQLFYPCKCDGSIKYVHQECLIQWLKVSKKKNPKCELCGETFKFQNVYAEGAPSTLALFELIKELIPRMFRVITTVLKYVIAVTLWGVCLPIFTHWWIKLCWCFVSTNEITTCHWSPLYLFDSVEHLTTSWYSGIVNICVIIAVSVLCFELGQLIYKELEIVDRKHKLRQLERRLQDTIGAMSNLEEKQRQLECKHFAIQDYESLKYEWDLRKQQQAKKMQLSSAKSERGMTMSGGGGEKVNMDSSAGGIVEGGGALQAASASSARNTAALDDFDKVKQLFSDIDIDKVYARRMVTKLNDIVLHPELGFYVDIKLCYERLLSIYDTNMDECLRFRKLYDHRFEKSVVREVMQEVNSINAKIAGEESMLAAEDEKALQQERGEGPPEEVLTMELTAAEGEVFESDNLELLGRMLMERFKREEEIAKKRSNNEPVSEASRRLVFDAATGHLVDPPSPPVHMQQAVEQPTAAVHTVSDEQRLQDAPDAEFDAEMEHVWAVELEREHQENETWQRQCQEQREAQLKECNEAVLMLREDKSESHFLSMQPSAAEETVVADMQERSQSEGKDLECEGGGSPATVIADKQGDEDSDSFIRDVVKEIVDELVVWMVEVDRERREVIDPPGPVVEREVVSNLAPAAAAAEPAAVNDVAVLAPPPPADAQPAPAAGAAAVAPVAPVQVQAHIVIENKHLLVVLGYITSFVFLSLVVPSCIGKLMLYCLPQAIRTRIHEAVVQLVERESNDSNGVLASKVMLFFDIPPMEEWTEATKAEVVALVQKKLYAILQISVGYSTYALLLAVLFSFYYIKYYRLNTAAGSPRTTWKESILNQLKIIKQGVNSIVKIKVLLLVYGVLIPGLLAQLLFLCIKRNLSPAQRESLSKTDSVQVLFAIFLYLLSFLFMGHILTITYQLRLLIQPQYLSEVLPNAHIFDQPAAAAAAANNNNIMNVNGNNAAVRQVAVDPNGADPPEAQMFPFQEKFLQLSYSKVLLDALMNLSMLLPGLVLTVLIPLRLGHYLCPGTGGEPLVFQFKHVVADVQVPIEMILSHILIPLFIEKMNYKVNVQRLLHAYLRIMAPYLGLEWMLVRDAFPTVFAGPTPEVVPVVPGAPVPQVLPLQPVEEAQHDLPQQPEQAEQQVNREEPASPVHNSVDGQQQHHAGGWVEVDFRPMSGDEPASPTAHAEAPADSAPATAMVEKRPFTVRDLPEPVRMGLFVGIGLISIAVVSSWLIHLPLYAGRFALSIFNMPASNDLFTYPSGLLVCWTVSYLLHYVLKDIDTNVVLHSFLRSVAKWSWITLQVLAVGGFWLIVPPFLLGMLLEALIIVPLRTPHNESPQYVIMQGWAFGIIILKLWMRAVLSGVFGELTIRLQMEMVLVRGFAQFNAKETIQHVVMPVTLRLLDLWCIPYFLARLVCMGVSYYPHRTLIMRYCIHVYIVARLLFYATKHMCTYLINLHNEIRDSRYLVGMKLTNRKAK